MILHKIKQINPYNNNKKKKNKNNKQMILCQKKIMINLTISNNLKYPKKLIF